MRWVKEHGHKALAGLLVVVSSANGMEPDTVKAWLLYALATGTLAWSFFLAPAPRSGQGRP
jgi:hypothetical protein